MNIEKKVHEIFMKVNDIEELVGLSQEIYKFIARFEGDVKTNPYKHILCKQFPNRDIHSLTFHELMCLGFSPKDVTRHILEEYRDLTLKEVLQRYN